MALFDKTDSSCQFNIKLMLIESGGHIQIWLGQIGTFGSSYQISDMGLKKSMIQVSGQERGIIIQFPIQWKIDSIKNDFDNICKELNEKLKKKKGLDTFIELFGMVIGSLYDHHYISDDAEILNAINTAKERNPQCKELFESLQSVLCLYIYTNHFKDTSTHTI